MGGDLVRIVYTILRSRTGIFVRCGVCMCVGFHNHNGTTAQEYLVFTNVFVDPLRHVLFC